MKRFRKLLHLSQTDRRLLVRAVLLLGATRVGLWLLPFQTLRRALAGVTWEPTMPPHGAPPPADRIAWAVAVASGYVPKATCLTQALAVQALLGRDGFSADLRIGVTRSGDGRLEAHAWIESHGRVLVGAPGLDCYTLLGVLN